jgi:adenine-specific DNA-methyltransferase
MSRHLERTHPRIGAWAARPSPREPDVVDPASWAGSASVRAIAGPASATTIPAGVVVNSWTKHTGAMRSALTRDPDVPTIAPMSNGEAALPLDGEEHQRATPTAERRRTGRVYTPEHVARFVVDLAGLGDRGAPAGALLDPACGAGVFLIAAIEEIANAHQFEGGARRTARRARTFLDTVEASVFGVDIDPIACSIARAAAREAVSRYVSAPIPRGYLDANVVEADFLMDDAVRALRPASGFAFVVGNPPYVSATRLPARYKEGLRRLFKTSSGRLDLYTAFMEHGLALLAPGGRLAFITPDKFLNSQTSAALRGHLLAHATLRVIARFDSHKVFDEAATVPCITVFEKGTHHAKTDVLQCESVGDPPAITVVDRSSVAARTLGSAPWRLQSDDARSLVARLEGRHPRVQQLAARISAGPASGRDKLFVFADGEAPDVEAELLVRAVRGRDINAFRIQDPGLRALVPYEYDAFGNGTLVRLADYPRAARYLRSIRASLEERHCVRVWERAWHEWHDPVTTDIAARRKLLVPDVANTSRFAVDDGRFLPLHSVYYLVPRSGVDADFLAGVLNSFVAEFIVRTLSPVVKDGFSRYRQQFVAALPVPLATPSITRRVAAASRAADRERVNDLVAELFGVDDRERAAIERALTRGGNAG